MVGSIIGHITAVANISDGDGSTVATIPKLDHFAVFLGALTKDVMFLLDNKTKETKQVFSFMDAWSAYCEYKSNGDSVTVEVLDKEAAKVLYGQQTT